MVCNKNSFACLYELKNLDFIEYVYIKKNLGETPGY